MDAYTIISSNYLDDCPHHDSWENIIEDKIITTKTSINELFTYFEKEYKDKIENVHLRNPFVSHILIRPEERKFEAMIPDSRVEEFILKNKIEIGYNETAYKLPSPEGGYTSFDKSFEWKDLTLEQVGVPKFDILQIESKTKDYYIELTSEKPKHYNGLN